MAKVTGGEKLIQALTKYAGPKLVTLRVGFLEGATYPDGTSVPMVAAIQEFGAPSRKIPPRPFFRRMVAEKSGSWGDAIAANLKATGFDAEKAMKRVGAGIAAQLQLSIRDLTSPSLAPSTVRAKGFDKPLIDTAVMANSIQWEVDEAIAGKVKPISAPARRARGRR
jgi:hypothetical protein